MIRRRVLVTGAVAACCLSLLPTLVPLAADSLPSRLSDSEFWKLVSDFSEPNGTFRSDNLLSNEGSFQYVLSDLMRTAKPGRVYMGVGPEQNFTYIAALKPAMAFIVDVRRGNLDLHLMYKALFELSADRAEFVSRLFSKKRPDGLTSASTASEIFSAFWDVETSEALYKDNLRAIERELTEKHQFEVSAEDLQGIEYVYWAFYWYGPRIQYSSTGSFGGRYQPTYTDLMVATDGSGQPRGYLASEANFAVLKALESKNLLVPVVGNFAGPKAIRAVGEYLRKSGATVSAFYLSNVEQYLYQEGLWRSFCGNVATLPLDSSSTFIRSVRGGQYVYGMGLNLALAPITEEVKACTAEERPSRY